MAPWHPLPNRPVPRAAAADSPLLTYVAVSNCRCRWWLLLLLLARRLSPASGGGEGRGRSRSAQRSARLVGSHRRWVEQQDGRPNN